VGREHPTVIQLSKHRSDINVFTAHTEISREMLISVSINPMQPTLRTTQSPNTFCQM